VVYDDEGEDGAEKDSPAAHVGIRGGKDGSMRDGQVRSMAVQEKRLVGDEQRQKGGGGGNRTTKEDKDVLSRDVVAHHDRLFPGKDQNEAKSRTREDWENRVARQHSGVWPLFVLK
jgi:hypothetical protein